MFREKKVFGANQQWDYYATHLNNKVWYLNKSVLQRSAEVLFLVKKKKFKNPLYDSIWKCFLGKERKKERK